MSTLNVGDRVTVTEIYPPTDYQALNELLGRTGVIVPGGVKTLAGDYYQVEMDDATLAVPRVSFLERELRKS